MSHSVAIRTAEMKVAHPINPDTDEFRQAYRSCALDQLIESGRPVSEFQEPDHWYLDPRLTILGVQDDARVIAFIIISLGPYFYEDTHGEVLDIWVTPEMRRAGLATTIADAAFRRFSGMVAMQVSRSNTASLNFWTKFVLNHDLALEREERFDGRTPVFRLVFRKK